MDSGESLQFKISYTNATTPTARIISPATPLYNNAAYLRCKNIQLGYTVPRNITKKVYISNLKIYASIDNLFTITKFPVLTRK